MNVVLPKPKVAVSGRDGRGREMLYVLSEAGGEADAVLVSVTHSGQAKAFQAHAYRVKRSQDGPFEVTKYADLMGMEGGRALVAQKPVGRYSAKALEAFAAEAQTRFEALFADGYPRLMSVFDDKFKENS